MKQIELTKDEFALFDDEDFVTVSQHRWYLRSDGIRKYAAARVIREHRRTTIEMHRLVLGLNIGQKIMVDHIDGNGLNNQKTNLRLANDSQNQMNQRPRRGCTSEYKGVSRCSETGMWRSKIVVARKQIYLGRYKDERKAAQAYDEAAERLFGQFARLNFPGEALD